MMKEPLRITSPDGADLAVYRSGTGPNLLLVHGTTADHTRWSGIVPLLARAFTVYTMDRRGRGGSTDGPTCSIALEAGDIRAVAHSIGAPVDILGHSYGAICCLEAATDLPQLRRLVLYEPPLPVGHPIVAAEVREELEALGEAGSSEALLLAFFRRVVRVPEQQLDVMRASPAWRGRVAAAHTIAREVRLEAEYQPDLQRLAAVDVPTLLLLGGDSPQYFRAAIEVLSRVLPRSRIREMPGQQHVAMDTIPAEFVALVTSFLLQDDGVVA